jgi:protein-tyrosine phosphatase
MAEVILSAKLADAGLGDAVSVHSSGTGDWHIGEPMDQRAAVTLTEQGYDATRHRARQIAHHTLTDTDLILVMDRSNLRDVRALAPDGVEPERVMLFRTFDPLADEPDVPDPWYGGPDGFGEVLAIVERTTDVLVDALRRVV